MNRAFSICKALFYLAVACLSAVTIISAQNRGVIVARSAPVHIAGETAPVSQRSRTVANSASELEKEAFQLINAERQKRGLSPLVWNERIAQIARQHSRDMAQQHYFSHQEKDGSTVSERASRNGVAWMGIGENIVYFQGYDDPAKTATTSWMESPGHRKNILNNTWQESGIGAAVAPDGSYYLTQVFVSPLNNVAKTSTRSDKPKAILVDEF